MNKINMESRAGHFFLVLKIHQANYWLIPTTGFSIIDSIVLIGIEQMTVGTVYAMKSLKAFELVTCKFSWLWMLWLYYTMEFGSNLVNNIIKSLVKLLFIILEAKYFFYFLLNIHFICIHFFKNNYTCMYF